MNTNQGICKILSNNNQYLGSCFKLGDYDCEIISLSGMILSCETAGKERIYGAILIKTSNSIKEVFCKMSIKSKVKFRAFGVCINCSKMMLASIIDTLGIRTKSYYLEKKKSSIIWPIESESAGIISREGINEPLQSGIFIIDGLIPIGLGQRELVLGDRITGKTCIGVDMIYNQKKNDLLCVYNAIGLKSGEILSIYSDLFNMGSDKYTIICYSSSSCCSISQYLCVNTSTSICEYFMYIYSCNSMVIYDDLSKHAIATREIYLLLGRPPGREAYPGEIFYVHSKLLERCCKLNLSMGLGSISGIPVLETQFSDVSSYISTNVISITDGQIFCCPKLFLKNNKPAIDIGLSVSE